MWRCRFLLVLLATLLAEAVPGGIESAKVTLDYVAKKALERARKPFHSPRASLPDFLQPNQLDYDRYREIRFRHDHALWTAKKLPFRVEFFHPGYIYQELVQINEFNGTYVQPVPFVEDFFDYGKLFFKARIPVNTGYAGFRLLYSLNEPDKMDELGAFLGASYFRLLGKGQRYGQSARGLALDCGENDRPEEFPIFVEFWLGEPRPADKTLQFYALLDSVSCTGAYAFNVRPGPTTVAEVQAELFFREPDKIQAAAPQRKILKTLGMAPLTSMFWFGENTERRIDDYRPEVHDSDGLLIHMEHDEMVWRPLNNPKELRHQVFPANNVKGFGLLQRDRDFAHYQDLFNSYQLVPSVWVEPVGAWGEGAVHLVELNGRAEGDDNVVAFWSPKERPRPLEPFRFAYSLSWMGEAGRTLSEEAVLATRIGANPRNGQQRQIAIDFSGPRLNQIPENEPPQAVAGCSTNAAIVETQVFHNPFNGGWRVILELAPKPGGAGPVSLQCTLKRGEVTSENWNYLWSTP